MNRPFPKLIHDEFLPCGFHLQTLCRQGLIGALSAENPANPCGFLLRLVPRDQKSIRWDHAPTDACERNPLRVEPCVWKRNRLQVQEQKRRSSCALQLSQGVV